MSVKGYSVLIVEDERIVAKDLQQTLLAFGYDAFGIVSSAKDAIEAATRRRPDVVLMDIRIKGGLDGVQTADIFRTRFDVPTIYLTAHADLATIERAKETDPHGYLLKPVQSAELRGAIEISRHRRVLEKRLRETEQRFRLAFEEAPIGMTLVALDGTMLRANQALCRLVGYEREALIGLPFLHINVGAEHALEIAQHRHLSVQSTLARKDRSLLDVILHVSMVHDAAGEPLQYIAQVEDVSERKRAAAELSRSEGMLKHAQKVAALGSWELDLRTQRITRSEEFCRILGFGLEEATSSQRGLLDVVHADDKSRVAEGIERAIATGQPWVADFRILRGDEVRHLHVRAETESTPSGERVRVIGTAQDVTERRQVEAQLVTAERMASVGTLAAGVAHEINNPLSYVITNLELVDEALRHGTSAHLSELVQMVDEARNGAERVRKIVRGLNTFARGEREELVPVDVGAALEVSLALAHAELKHRATVKKSLGIVPRVMADEARLVQVFVNLLVNAAHALEGRPIDQNTVQVSCHASEHGGVTVEISDNGPGISEAIQRRIFEPFFTTKPVGRGTGLGLSVAQNIVHSFNGTLSCESAPGRGATFRVTLPSPAQRPPDEVKKPHPAGKRGRVLVIDDEPSIGTALTRLLSEHEVIAVQEVATARALLTEGKPFDAVLCDLMMPNGNGIEFHAWLSKTVPEMASRVVFITGAATMPEFQAFLDTVPNACLQKPFDAQAMRAAVRCVVDGHLAPTVLA